jgi:perosamine synthetase
MTAPAGVAPMSIPLTRPVLGEAEERAVLEVLRSGWLVQGPKVAELERVVASLVGARHAVATSNCTTALHLALILHGIGAGDEVIVPSFTFIATANAVTYTGATPVFADIDPRTYNLDPDAVNAAITPRTKAIMPVHQIGLAADVDRLRAIARQHGTVLIEDAAPALGATYRGRPVGGLGNTSCFSFHPRKAITTGEGGMITTDDGALAERARVLRAHGMSVSDLARHQARRVIIEEYQDVGYNYRMSDVHAAIGIEQLKRLPSILAQRCELAERYTAAFSDLEGVQLPFSSGETPHTYQSYMIQLRAGAGSTRERLMDELLAASIPTRRGVMAIHREPVYRKRCGSVSLPVTETAAATTVLIPLYAGMTDGEQEYVIDHVRRALGRS